MRKVGIASIVLSIYIMSVSGCMNRDIMRSSGADSNREVPTISETTDAPYLPTHQMVIDEMFAVANVKGDDILYDLGSGDGRIPISAALKFGTKGVGIDIDPVLVKEANENAVKAKVEDKVTFIVGDIFEQDFSKATVVMLYLSPDLNLQLRPQLMKLKSGTRIVSHNHSMGDWKPEQTRKVTTPGGVVHTVYFWRIP